MLLLVTLIAASEIFDPAHSMLSGAVGDDFIPSYMAGTFVRAGRPDLLTDYPEAVRFQSHLRRVEGLEQHGRTGPWLNPPFFALLFAPLAALPFHRALGVWFGFNLLLLTASIALLCRMLMERADDGGMRTPDEVATEPPGGAMSVGQARPAPSGASLVRLGLIPLLVPCSMPLVQAMACQQNTFLSLAILSLTVVLWRREKALSAGMVGGLLLFKPQLAGVIAVVMVLSLGWRALLGWSITGCALLAATLILMPGAIADYLLKLPTLLPWLKAGQHYAWERQITLQGFWRLLLQGSVSGPAPLRATVMWMGSAAVAWTAIVLLTLRMRRVHDARGRDRLIAAIVAAMPLLMPYFMDYDLLLLAVPAVLFAADWIASSRSQATPTQKLTLAAWCVLFVWLFFNAAFGAATRVSITVPLLACIAGLLARRAWCTERTDAADDGKHLRDMRRRPVRIGPRSALPARIAACASPDPQVEPISSR